MKKITSEDIEEQEANSLLDAIGNCLELNNDFLARYCSDEFKIIISKVPESDREYILSGIEEQHWFNGSPAGNNSQDIWLDISEIEYQFEGAAEDVFENPDDLTINGDLAYLYVGYGFSIKYNREELIKAVDEFLQDNKGA